MNFKKMIQLNLMLGMALACGAAMGMEESDEKINKETLQITHPDNKPVYYQQDPPMSWAEAEQKLDKKTQDLAQLVRLESTKNSTSSPVINMITSTKDLIRKDCARTFWGRTTALLLIGTFGSMYRSIKTGSFLTSIILGSGTILSGLLTAIYNHKRHSDAAKLNTHLGMTNCLSDYNKKYNEFKTAIEINSNNEIQPHVMVELRNRHDRVQFQTALNTLREPKPLLKAILGDNDYRSKDIILLGDLLKFNDHNHYGWPKFNSDRILIQPLTNDEQEKRTALVKKLKQEHNIK
jgi:hypothetical protein